MTAKLHAQWIVGFVDGEGCFHLDVHQHEEMRWGIQMQPEFTVVQNEVDSQILYALKDYFQCGSVGKNREDKYGRRLHYRVKGVKLLHEKIIPFFEKHPLKTKKNIEFGRFRTIVRLMHDGYHLKSLKNLLDIVDQGEALRVRSRPKKLTKRGEDLAEVVNQLRQTLILQKQEESEQEPS